MSDPNSKSSDILSDGPVKDILRPANNYFTCKDKFLARPKIGCTNCTRQNAQVVTGLQTSCYKSVHKLSTSCLRTACSQL
jgi:hypothetical protein